MLSVEKTELKQINKIDAFQEGIKKLTLNETLTYDEKSYMLASAILLIKYFEKDKRYKTYLELSYYIILKYAISYNDYEPLFDFSVNFGFFPIAKYIINNNLLEKVKLNDCLVEMQIDRYLNDGYIETLEQKKVREAILNDTQREISYIAPTSYGKSSIIIEHIQKYLEINKKVAIIVPTKSLLMQTYRLVRSAGIKRRILIHDEMYQEEQEFIGIFTQERALRLLERDGVEFDILYIDEAHNLFNKDERNILLSRVIRKNSIKNPKQKIMYLSPLIEDTDNLHMYEGQVIKEQRIEYNIKEMEIQEFKLTGDVCKYNRFTDTFYSMGKHETYFDYINQNTRNKNFIYIRSPKKIERFARNICEKISKIEDQEIQRLITELRQVVHKQFYMIDLLEYGVIYLHGKLPDLIKEYVEYSCRKIPNIRFIVANSVILEGINLPIDTLFILNTYKLQGKELTNLIGRVNRLNMIFNVEGKNNLNKLLPPIHFINTEEYNRKNSNMTNKIKLLRSKRFEDKIENPTLNNFDFDALRINGRDREKEKLKFEKIMQAEEFIMVDVRSPKEKLCKYLIENGIDKFYDVNDTMLLKIISRFEYVDENRDKWNSFNIIHKIYVIFINHVDELSDFEISRLEHEQARKYYNMHIKKIRENPLKQNIILLVKYFLNRIKNGDSLFYIGESYGELEKVTVKYEGYTKKVYVDLSTKSEQELVNLAIVKLKMEEDFVSNKLSKFIKMMYDYRLIDSQEYNLYTYGTTDKNKIEFIKTGLTLSLLQRLEKDNQLKNIMLDIHGNLKVNHEFEEYKESVGDFYKFEIERFL